MKELIFHRSSITFLLLIVLTFLAFWLGTSQPAERVPELKSVVWIELMFLAFLKARWVMMDFMELRGAPVKLRVLAECWSIATAGLLIAHNWVVG